MGGNSPDKGRLRILEYILSHPLEQKGGTTVKEAEYQLKYWYGYTDKCLERIINESKER